MAMIVYSFTVIVSCFLLSVMVLKLSRPMMQLLRNDAPRSPAVLATWVALGFLQVVGMPFAPWCVALALSIFGLVSPRIFHQGWIALLLASLALAVGVLAMGRPSYLACEAGIIAAACLAALLAGSKKHPILMDAASALSLAFALLIVAYGAVV